MSNAVPEDIEDEDVPVPISVGDWHELHVGDDIIVNGRPRRIYVKSLVHALPDETHDEHIARAEEIVLGTYLFHATQTRAFMESLNTQKRENQ